MNEPKELEFVELTDEQKDLCRGYAERYAEMIDEYICDDLHQMAKECKFVFDDGDYFQGVINTLYDEVYKQLKLLFKKEDDVCTSTPSN